MTGPTRRDQARAILGGRGRQMAREILGRRPVGAADFKAAFTCEWIDLIAEIHDGPDLLRLGRNVVGPRDGLYVFDEPDGWRLYSQERGEVIGEERGLDFDRARDLAIARIILRSGLPFIPEGMPDRLTG